MRLLQIIFLGIMVAPLEGKPPVVRRQAAVLEKTVEIDGQGQVKVQAADAGKELEQGSSPHTVKMVVDGNGMATKNTEPTQVLMARAAKEFFADEQDAALDELEAMTIQSSLAGKAPRPPPPRRRRAPPRRRRAPPPPPPPVNCEWGPWTKGECSKTCGGGKRTDTRVKTRTESNGGTCDGESIAQNLECNDEDCPTTTTLMTTVKNYASRMSHCGLGLCMVMGAILA